MRSDAISDEDLMRRAGEGDVEAFETLLTRYEGRILRYLNHAIGRATVAEELAAETFLRLFQSRAKYRPELPFPPYLFAIARHCLADYLQRREKQARLEPLGLPDDRAPDRGERPDQAASRAERANQLRDAVRDLPEPYREAVFLCYFEGMPPIQVAQALEIPPATARSRIARGLAALRERLTNGLGLSS